MNPSLARHLASAAVIGSFALLALGSSGSGSDSGAPAAGGCKTDMDCKGDRVCVASNCVDPPAVNQPPPPAQPPPPVQPPKPKPQVRRARQVSDPPGGCVMDGTIYEHDGTVYGCENGGNWCISMPPLAGGCAAH